MFFFEHLCIMYKGKGKLAAPEKTQKPKEGGESESDEDSFIDMDEFKKQEKIQHEKRKSGGTKHILLLNVETHFKF